MLLIGTVLCALAGALLISMAAAGRPVRGENMVGTHLVTGPLALGFTLGALLVQLAAPLPDTWPNIASWVLLPGFLIGMTFLPLAAYGGRSSRLVKLFVPAVVAAPFAIGHGAAVHAALPWAGWSLLTLVGAGGTWIVVGHRVRRFTSRLLRPFRRRVPSTFDVEQHRWQREQWQKVPAGASVAELLAHARSMAPDVRAECHARLLAHPDLEAGLAAAVRGEHPSNVLWYLVHHYPRAKAPFAAPVNDLLASLRATWPDRMRDDPHPRPWTGDLMPALDCATAVLLDGGDVRAEMQAWQRELASMPKFVGLAKEIARWLRKAG